MPPAGANHQPRLVVCIKQVPDTATLRLDPRTHTLRRGGAPAVVNPFDLPAIEEALRLRDLAGGRLTALSMGPPQAEAALRETLARGADDAVLLCDPAFAGGDTWATSLVLAAAIRRLGGADIVICGRQAADGDTAQVGPGLAARLGLPQATFVSAIHELSTASLIVERMLDDGVERLRVRLPCLLTIGRAIHPPRLPTLAGLAAMRRKPLLRWGATDLGLDPRQTGLAGSPTRVVRVAVPRQTRRCEFLEGSAGERAAALAARLRDWLGRNPAPAADGPRTPPPAPRPDNPPPLPTAGDVWVVAETAGGRLREVTLELLGAGRALADKLGATLRAVLAGAGVAPLAPILHAHGADGVLMADDPLLDPFQDERHAALLAALVESRRPAIVLCAATAVGRSLAARVAAAVHAGLTADCTGLDIDEDSGRLLQTRPAFGGNVLATIVTPERRPQMATVRPKVMRALPPDPARHGRLERVTLPPAAAAAGTERLRFEGGADGGGTLAEAAVVVAGGRGAGRDGFELLGRLAARLGGEVGASRAAVEAGWMPAARQIGQTGRTVRPRLYLACGISGAIQHLAGIAAAGMIVAVNRDPEAPIFKTAHLGIVGDWRELAAALLERL